ncbi:SbcC/MukB-like Walker B domain-containing protein [Ferrovibrio sp. MS7]|uniref:SbcC/MukB-like Walker B domain-containing protein n=1 Tax=Ferrovibrio plantarum TaxID=3119164 RepID=UPI003136DFF2
MNSNTLERLTAINWYLYQAEDIRFGPMTVIFGGNGAGKTALLDAIQCCLLGIDHRAQRLNSRSEDGSTAKQQSRSVHSYILGKVKDRYTRESAYSYLAAGYHCLVTGKYITIGVGMKASIEDKTEAVDVRFVIEGDRLLAKEDFSYINGDEFYVRDWKSVKSALDDDDFLIQTYTKAKDFRLAWHRILNAGPGGARAASGMSDQRFTRAFRQALKFETGAVRDISDFMRTNILPDDVLPVGTWQEQYAQWKAMLDRLRRTEAEFEAVKAIGRAARSAIENEMNLAAIEWLKIRIPRQTKQRRVRKEMIARRKAKWEIGQITHGMARLENERDRVNQDLGSTERQLTASPEAERVQRLKERGEYLQQNLDRLDGAVEEIRVAILSVPRHVNRAVDIGLDVSSYVSDATAIIDLMDGSKAWQARFDDVFNAYESLRTSGLIEAIRGLVARAAAEAEGLKREVAELQRMIELAKDSRDPVPSQVSSVIDRLIARGIKARPLSALVDIKPEFKEWRRTVEGILGDMCHGIVVQPDDIEAAAVVANTVEGDPIVIRTNKLPVGHAKFSQGSLAEVCVVTDSLARAVIEYQIGRIFRVTTEAELKEVDRGATIDGRLASGITIRRARRYGYPQLFGSGTGLIKEVLQKKLADINVDLRPANAKVKLTQDLLSGILAAFDKVPADRTAASQVLWNAKAGREDLERNSRELDAAMDAIDPELGNKISGYKKELDGINGQLAEDKSKRKDLEKTALEAETTVKNYLPEVRSMLSRERRIAADAKRADLLDDLESAIKLITDKLSDTARFNENCEGLIKEYKRGLDRARTTFANARTRYLDAHDPHGIPTHDDEQLSIMRRHAAWTDRRCDEIENDILRPYSEDVRRAADLFLETTRTAFFDMILLKIAEQRRVQNDLNVNLRGAQFNEMIFQITSSPNARLSEYLNLAERVRSNHKILSMDFIEQNPHHNDVKIIKQMMDMLTGGTTDDDPIKELIDPRNYYEYDLDIYNAATFVGAGKTKPLGKLSNMIGDLSGGEREAPFYICLGVAVAMAYFGSMSPTARINRSGTILLDEAFNKFEPMNVAKTIEFFRRTGLQLICVAPSTNKAVYYAKMDTAIVLTKVSSSNIVHIEYVNLKEKGRKLLEGEMHSEVTA